jgi:hypothetical protein
MKELDALNYYILEIIGISVMIDISKSIIPSGIISSISEKEKE